jgi:hypothetical protein
VFDHASLRSLEHHIQRCEIRSGKFPTGVIVTVKAERETIRVLLEDPNDPP